MAISHVNAVESNKVKGPIEQVQVSFFVQVNIVALRPSISASLSEGIVKTWSADFLIFPTNRNSLTNGKLKWLTFASVRYEDVTSLLFDRMLAKDIFE